MIKINFDSANTLLFNDFIVMASTDMFWEARALFGCEFFTPELQAALRNWIKKENYLVRDFWPERMQEKFEEFLIDSRGVGLPLDSLVQWLARGSVSEDKSNANFGWQNAFANLTRPDEPYPPGVGRETYRRCIVLVSQRYEQPRDAANEFLKSISREWNCYPERLSPGQKDYNLRSKSEWDRTIYEYCVLFYEMYVDVALGAPSNQNFWQDFVQDYSAQFDAAQKSSIFEAVASFVLDRKLAPDWSMYLPIEDLSSPIPKVGAGNELLI